MRSALGAGVAVSIAFAAGFSSAAEAPALLDPAAAPAYVTGTRPPRSRAEKAVVSESVSFDPALDCVAAGMARRAPAPPDPHLYRNELPIACGSPLYPIDASVVPAGKVRDALDHAYRVLTEPGPIALGVAPWPGRPSAVVVVAARRGVALEPFPRDGAKVLRGTFLVPTAANPVLFLSEATPRGVRKREVTLSNDRRFQVALDGAPDADLELQFRVGREYGPAARVRVGAGAGLVEASRPTLASAVAAARARLGMAPLADAGQPGDCESIPAKVGDIDISDRATCSDVPLLGPADLPSEVAFRAGLMAFFFDPRVTLLQIAPAPVPPLGNGVAIRVLRRFETLDPASGRARIIELLRRRWPGLRERPAPAGALAALAAKLIGQTADNNATAAVKPAIDRIAARWTTTRRYYSGLLLSRDVEKLIELIQPGVTPLAIDVALVQGRSADTSLYNYAAIVLEIP